MNTLNLKDLKYSHNAIKQPENHQDAINWGSIGNLANFSYSFQFGRAFLLKTEPDGGGWALSWIIAGLIKQDDGVVEKNNIAYITEERRRDSWCVRYEPSPKFLFWETTVRSQIRHGLKKISGQYSQSEKKLVADFSLSPERYNHSLKQLSSEAWRASCAIGIAYRKNIFCFPYMPPEYLNKYSWFKETINMLREVGALVLVPTQETEFTKSWFDEIVVVPE